MFQPRSSSTCPTQAASSAWVLGTPQWLRLNLVNPPEAVSTGNLVARKALTNAHRVELTAAASRKGALAVFSILSSRVGSLARKSSTERAAFFLLHASQAKVRFDIRLLPPRAFDWICSIWSGRSWASQYAQVRCHFCERYSRTS